MTPGEHFRISAHLKDIIGRDLVTNQFVAVFELVKNAFDAHATRVDIGFDLDHNRLWIVDDGKGMDAETIRTRWLFVGYSAKADGTEDTRVPTNYRSRIRTQGKFAGNKGIGRFSCDTLGESLVLYSRPFGKTSTQILSVEWKDFEADSQNLFQDIRVTLDRARGFPSTASVPMPTASGTVLRIDCLRAEWDATEILRLRRHLEKLIDPFGTTQHTPVHIAVVDKDIEDGVREALEGPVGNDLRDLLSMKTTRVKMSASDSSIKTELVDRGRTIYRISEDNDYKGLEGASVQAELFYLNRSAKLSFAHRMGMASVKFGSIFLFVNGFRIFPIGEETDDTFGLNRRKQQGSSRYVGTRDVMGRVDVTAPNRYFREASSRDGGLIEDARVRDLYDAIRKMAIFRLERYVVGVTWKDKADHLREDASALSIGATRGRIATLVGQLASAKDIVLEYYDPEIIEIFDEDSQSLDGAMKSLVSIAERQGDTRLLRRIERARARLADIKKSEREAVKAAERAMREKERADQHIATLERQATYLAATKDMTAEQMTLLLHQVLIYAGHIDAAIRRALNAATEVAEAAQELRDGGESTELADSAASVRVYTGQLLDDLQHIHLENDRLKAVARFASNISFELESDHIDGDIVAFLDEYVNELCASRNGKGSIFFETNGLSLVSTFRPVDLVVVIDNLMDNARKHGARQMRMCARRGRSANSVEVLISDDGRGLDEDRIDPAHIFDKGYTSTPGGMGLGLYHARKVMEEMRGSLQLNPVRQSGRADFLMTLSGNPR